MNIQLTFKAQNMAVEEDSIDFFPFFSEEVVKERLAVELMGLGGFRFFIVQAFDDV